MLRRSSPAEARSLYHRSLHELPQDNVFKLLAKKRYDAQIAALDALANESDPEKLAAELRKVFAKADSFLVAKAARITADKSLRALIPDLIAALDRFYTESDSQCWAKNGLVDALAAFEFGDSAVYLRGMKHVQMEPVYGKSVDTAGPLRARCTVALVQCRDLSDQLVLQHLLEALADKEQTVRAEAARSIGRVARNESALLLRLKALCGDEEPEVTGACFSALLGIEGRAGIGFVSRFLERDNELAAEAAIALGLTHDPEALKILQERWNLERRNTMLVGPLLTGIALTSLPEAIAFLTELVADGSSTALEALASARLTDDDRARILRAVESTANPHLRAVFEKRIAAR